ncbi:hypothetical protein IMZ48_38490 [Candidatus Bathyarchaeota archaeon]|nr:hypothetical protein [Candidatus Bathyarchaeota archaeon]
MYTPAPSRLPPVPGPRQTTPAKDPCHWREDQVGSGLHTLTEAKATPPALSVAAWPD